jgi:hypothetical protein
VIILVTKQSVPIVIASYAVNRRTVAISINLNLSFYPLSQLRTHPLSKWKEGGSKILFTLTGIHLSSAGLYVVKKIKIEKTFANFACYGLSYIKQYRLNA